MVKDIKQYDTGWVCPECGMTRGSDGYDPCLGQLPGVDFACCGHGGKSDPRVCNEGYIKFANGKIIRFKKLIRVEN